MSARHAGTAGPDGAVVGFAQAAKMQGPPN